MYSLVLDLSALIPCGDKSKEDKEAIQKLGNTLPKTRSFTIYVSPYLIKVYHEVFSREFKKCHPLPSFQASLSRILPQLRKISKTRGKLCKTIPTQIGIKFHILETKRVQYYEVNDVGLTNKDDKEVLRIALAVSYQETFLVTIDRHFFENLNQNALSRRYPNESQKIRIVKPNDPLLTKILQKELH